MNKTAWMLGASLAALAPAAAHAQQATEAQATPQDDQSSANAGVEDIIVTAQKRAENLQNVPISVTALSTETLVRSGVNSLDSVQRLAPGLNMSAIGSGFVSYTYVRGAGTNVIDSGSDPSVAFFVDEIYLGGTAGLQFDLFDIERIEVLKGPQGTLFGRNAAAGAISITTKRPSSTPSATAILEAGNYGAALARVSLTGPLDTAGKWKYRVSGALRRRGAYTENPAGDDPGTLNNYGGRAQLEYDSGNIDALVSAEYFRADNGMTNQFLASANKTGLVTPAGIALLPTDESFYRHSYNVDGFENQREVAVSGRLQWDLGGVSLTSISAYRNNLFDRLQDQEGTVLDVYSIASREHVRTFSQEYRLANDSGNRLEYILGLYYYRSKISRFDTIDTGPYYASVAVQNRVATDNHTLFTKSYAAFGQATFHVTEELSLTAGGRYTRDEKESARTVDRYQLGGPQNLYSIDPHVDFESFDPAFTVDYQANRNLLLYASYKRGFKSGGWQSLAPLRDAALFAFKPEHVVAYEVGVKSELADGKLRLNLAGFRAKVEDQQILRFPNATSSITDNAGETVTKGVDVQVSAVPVPRLRLDVNATYQQARFTVYNSFGQNFVGNHQLRSPDFSISATGEYSAPLGDWGDLTARGEYFHQSAVFFDAANTSGLNAFQPAYDIVNARLILAPESKKWDLAFWVKNVLDRRYFRNIALVGPSGIGTPGDPRTVGGTLTWKFE